MSKILVTGGAGHIGSHVCDLLVEQGHYVTSLDFAHDENELSSPRHTKVCNMAMPTSRDCQALGAFDIIYHLAANANVRETTECPIRGKYSGSRSTVEVLDFAAKTNTPVVFVSSVLARYPLPLPYAIEKRAGEEYCQHYTNHFGVPTSIIRLNNVYGSPRHKPSSGNVIPSFLDQKRTKGRITITGDGSQVRDFIHYTDAVRAIVAAADRDGITEIGSCQGRSIREVAELFDCPIDYVPRAGGEVDRQVCQYSDYPCTVDFEAAVRELAGTEQLESTTGCSLAASGRFWGDEA